MQSALGAFVHFLHFSDYERAKAQWRILTSFLDVHAPHFHLYLCKMPSKTPKAKKKKSEKYLCSCGCGKKVERHTERRHLNPEQAPLYARLAQLLQRNTEKTGKAAQKLWQQAANHFSPRPSPQAPTQDARMASPPAEPFGGSPMQFGMPMLPQSPQMAVSPRQAAEAVLQAQGAATAFRGVMDDDEDDSEEGKSDESDNSGDSGDRGNEGDEEDEAIMQELWEEYEGLAHQDISDSDEDKDKEDETDNETEDEDDPGSNLFYDTADVPQELRKLISHLSKLCTNSRSTEYSIFSSREIGC